MEDWEEMQTKRPKRRQTQTRAYMPLENQRAQGKGNNQAFQLPREPRPPPHLALPSYNTPPQPQPHLNPQGEGGKRDVKEWFSLEIKYPQCHTPPRKHVFYHFAMVSMPFVTVHNALYLPMVLKQ